MFYMGGMTLGYFSPHPRDAGRGEPAEGSCATERKPEHKGLLDLLGLLKPTAEIRQPKPSRQPPVWPIHIFY